MLSALEWPWPVSALYKCNKIIIIIINNNELEPHKLLNMDLKITKIFF